MPENTELDDASGRINKAFESNENLSKVDEIVRNSPNSNNYSIDYPLSAENIGSKTRFRNFTTEPTSAGAIEFTPIVCRCMASQLTRNILKTSETQTKNSNLFVNKFSHHQTNEAFAETEEEKFHSSNNKSVPEEKSTSQQDKESKPILWTQILATLLCASVHLCVGTVVGYTGVTLPSMMDPNSEDLILTKFEASIFSSIINIGAIVGSLISSVVMVWIGQRSTLLMFLPVGMLSWVILGFAHSFWLLLVARILQGLVIGVTAGCANNYVVEFAHTSIRGRLFASIDLSLQVGFFFVYLVGSTALSWRTVGLLCGIISMAIPFVGMLFLPHSPRWLAIQGRMEEAERALVFFRGSHYNVGPEMKEIMHQTSSANGNSTVRSQFKKLREKSIFSRFIIIAILLFASHYTGNFAMITYSVSIFESANVSINPYLSTIVSAITRIIGVSIYLVLADKFGRRPLFLIPLFLSGICMAALGFFFYAKLFMDDVSSISWLPLTSIVFFTLFTCMSHPVLMLLRSELLPTSVRAFGVGLLYFAFFCGTFCVSLTYPYMVDSIGSHWTFWIYGATSFLMVIIAAIFIPETKGKTLEEMDELFDKKKSKSGP